MHPAQGLYVEGLLEQTLSKPEDLLPVVNSGNKRRAVCFTEKNSHSSRSHAVRSLRSRHPSYLYTPRTFTLRAFALEVSLLDALST